MSSISSSKRRILAMDDDASIRSLFTVALTHFGYDVVVAGHGEEALQLFTQGKQKGESFDAVILDLTVNGGMGGEETLEKLLQIDPQVKAVISSGLDANPSDHVKAGVRAVISKPYRVDDLRKTLSEVIAAG